MQEQSPTGSVKTQEALSNKRADELEKAGQHELAQVERLRAAGHRNTLKTLEEAEKPE